MSYLAAGLAAVLYGIGTVLEATAARRSTDSGSLDPRLLLRLASQWVFLAALVVGAFGIAATALALRHLPLFAVQAAVASSVAVSAVIATVSHHESLSRRMQVGIGGIVAGLVLLGLSSGTEGPPDTSLAFRSGLAAAAVIGLALASIVGRRPERTALDVGLLGATAGLLYGIGNVGLRVVHDLVSPKAVADPAVWAAVIGGVGGILVLATALQRGSVALAAGAATTAETIVPALVGLLVLGERPRHGWGLTALVGFILAVAGAVALCGDVDHDAPPPDCGPHTVPGAGADVPDPKATP